MIEVLQQLEKGLSFGFFLAIIVKDEFLFVFPFPVAESTHFD